MNLLSDVWISFLKMPLWVKIWVFLILIPVNFASLLFLDNPNAGLIAFLATIGILLNIIPLWIYRGFTDVMAIPHVLFWVPLCIILVFHLFIYDATMHSAYRYFLLVLLFTNLISLVFDIQDVIKWFRNRSNNASSE